MNQVEYVKYRKDLEHSFKKASDQKLISRFNGQVRNSGWCNAKMIYLYCLQKEMTKRFDMSSVIVGGNCSYSNYIYLRNKKLLFII